MNNLSLKIYVGISRLALVVVGAAACHGISQLLCCLARLAPQVNLKLVSDHFSLKNKHI